MVHEFNCADCKKHVVHDSDSTTGYAVVGAAWITKTRKWRGGKKVCFACCGVRDKQTMTEKGHSKNLPLYLSYNGPKDKVTMPLGLCRNVVTLRPDDWHVGNWPGTLQFKVHRMTRGRHNVASHRYDVWFAGPDGYVWHGTQYGDWTQIVHCTRTKEPTAL